MIRRSSSALPLRAGYNRRPDRGAASCVENQSSTNLFLAVGLETHTVRVPSLSKPATGSRLGIVVRHLPRQLFLLLCVSASAAQAGAPLVTDDAAIVTPKTCQLEAWVRPNGLGRGDWVQPACNFTGDLELSMGVGSSRPDAGDASTIMQLQAKTVFHATADHVWSFGAVGGAGRDTGAPHGSSAYQLYYAKALVSWHPQSDLEVDFNLGAANLYGPGTFALAGVAIQYAVVPNLQLLAEIFRDQPGSGRYQIGARWLVIPDRFEAYVSYGNLFHGLSNEWSVITGIRLQTPEFLP